MLPPRKIPPAEYPFRAGIWMMNVSDDPGALPSITSTVNSIFGCPFTVPYPVIMASLPEMFSSLKDVAFKEIFEP
jgi:hypothetical protein